MVKCVNCGTESEGRYCPECGQKMQFVRMNIKTIFYDKIHDVTHWENTVLYTLRHLITSPGTTVKNYITGKKKSIVKPVKYFLSVSAIHVIVFRWMSKYFFEFQHSGEEANEIKDSMVAQNLLNSYINYFEFFMPVFFSVFLYLLYRKKTGVNYAESFAISFYWMGTTMVINVIMILLSVFEIRLWYAGLIINIIYLMYASLQFSGTHRVTDFIRSALFLALSYVSFLAAAEGAIIFYIKYIK